MKIYRGSLVVAAALVVGASAAAQSYQNIEQPALPAEGNAAPVLPAVTRLTAAEAVIGVWSPVAAAAAHLVIDKYGAPDEIHAAFLVWNHAGPWSRTAVFDSNDAPRGKDLALIEQSLDYALKPAQIDELASFDRRLSYNARTGQLSALSETEQLNFLRMNLADDVAAGRKTPQQARAIFDRTVSLSFSGKAAETMRGLHFPFGPVE